MKTEADVQAVTNNLGPCDDPGNCPWDVNGDGVVNGSDVAAVATHFGPSAVDDGTVRGSPCP